MEGKHFSLTFRAVHLTSLSHPLYFSNPQLCAITPFQALGIPYIFKFFKAIHCFGNKSPLPPKLLVKTISIYYLTVSFCGSRISEALNWMDLAWNFSGCSCLGSAPEVAHSEGGACCWEEGAVCLQWGLF